ncbi:hypothetical protein [Candidatus Carsonella ruddii]|nr:hypothetical protein [Candidatus Carsonella ruddii]WGS66848.1 hypothetical protein MEJ62_01020 [Candidatus Carsonella ruddii]WGS67040.1 hypothetical protein MEJ60_01025 [Candidatus Carsonella ruddii]
MNFYIKYNNLKIMLEKQFIFLCYDFTKINSSLINLIKLTLSLKSFYLNKKILKYFNIFLKKSIYLFLINNDYLKFQNSVIYIFNLLKIKPCFILTKNILIEKLPISEISKLSKENLILEIINFFKIKLLKLINILKNYGKNING